MIAPKISLNIKGTYKMHYSLQHAHLKYNLHTKIDMLNIQFENKMKEIILQSIKHLLYTLVYKVCILHIR